MKVQRGCRCSVVHETLVGKRRRLAVLAHTAAGQQMPADTDGSVNEEKEGHNLSIMDYNDRVVAVGFCVTY